MPNIILTENVYPDSASLRRVLDYVTRSGIVGGYAIDPDHAYSQISLIKRLFHKCDGKQLYHFFVSFTNGEMYRLTFDEILNVGFRIGQLFQNYQMVYAVHADTSHVHLHVVMNSVSFIDGYKYSGGLSFFFALKTMLQQEFPSSEVGIYRSYPQSPCNRFSHSKEDAFLRIDI